MSGGNGLLSAAAIIAVSGLASRALGLFRDRLLADRFGAGPVLDAYFAAYRIPDILYNLVILGALSAAFLPVVSRYLSAGDEGREPAFRMANALLTMAVSALAVVGVLLFAAAPLLVDLLAPGFDAERRALTILFTRIMLLQPIFLGASNVVSGLLLGFRRFVAYAAAPVLYNAGIVLGVLLFVPAVGPSGLAWGVVVGALLHLLVQLPAVARTGFRLRPAFTLQHDGLREIFRLFVPRLIGLVAGQVGALVVTVIGSGFLAGSIAAYVLAENLQSVPVGLVGVSMAVAAFPFLASAAARQEAAEFTETLSRALRLSLFVSLPASLFLLLFRAQVVRVILGTGAFDWSDTVATLRVLGVLALAVVPQSLIPILVRAFFSVHDTRTPMLVSLLAIVIHVGGAVLLAPALGLQGLAWAFAVSSLAHLVLLLTALHRRLGELDDGRLLLSVFRTAVAGLCATMVIQGPAFLLMRLGMDAAAVAAGPLFLFGLKGVVASLVNMQTFVGVATQLVASALGGLLVFLVVARSLGSSEILLLRDMLRLPRRFREALDERPKLS